MPGIGGLYETEDYASKALAGMQGVAQTTAAMDKARPGKPKKTVGGAMSAAAGGALAGSAAGIGVGTVVGAVAGLAMYYM